MDDVFGKKIGSVFESGLSDAESLEEKWSSLHQNGKAFHSWFELNKKEDFIRSVISSVRQRAGLGCPPEQFTTNRSRAHQRRPSGLREARMWNCKNRRIHLSQEH